MDGDFAGDVSRAAVFSAACPRGNAINRDEETPNLSSRRSVGERTNGFLVDEMNGT